MSTLQDTEEAGDAELISAVRGGDLSAYGVLFERHFDAARRLARQLTSHADADDLVSDAFAKVMRVLQNGGGPDLAFRAYLLTAVRRLHVDRIRSNKRLHTTDDLEAFDPGVPFRDTAVEGFENAAAAKAFASLPERWQVVLWHTEVEGQKPADIAPMLGMSANSVSALAYRAREGLRQAFLNSHAVELEDDQCRWTHEHLGGYVRHGLSKRDSGKVEKHLDECRGCMAIYLELTEVNSNLGALLAPLLLGTTAGVAYLSGAGSLAAKGGLLLLLGRAKDAILANTGTAAVSGAVAVTAIAGVSIAVATAGGPDRPTPEVEARVAPETSDSPAPSSQDPNRPAPARRSKGAPPVADPNSPPSTEEAEDPATSPAETTPSDEPSESPDDPGEDPTEQPPVQQPTPTKTPPDEPTDKPTEEPKPTYDLALSTTATPMRPGLGLRTRFDVSTSGYAPGGTATLTIEWTGVPLSLRGLPSNCRIRFQTATCDLSIDDPDLDNIRVFTALTRSIDLSLEPDNFTDADPDGNNTYSWP